MDDRFVGPLFLIGYRGTGKTTVARALANTLGWSSIDADVELERRAGKSIREIFADSGEPVFRDLEADVLADLAKLERHVVALGGGVILREQNRRVIAANGRAVWLQASAETIWNRIQADHTTSARRPNLTASGGYAEVVKLLGAREPFYREVADWAVDTEGKGPQQIADEIQHWIDEL